MIQPERLFNPPFVSRLYPSPATGREVTVYVKEMLLTDFPDKMVAACYEDVYAEGGAILIADTRGMRPWTVAEDLERVQHSFGETPREHPWSEVWLLPESSLETVLDLIKYTDFYGVKKMSCFEEAAAIIRDLHENWGCCITSASSGGIQVRLNAAPDPKSVGSIAEQVAAFCAKQFKLELGIKSIAHNLRAKRSVWLGFS